ncbi:MAG TPA: transcription antitermination factor NusB, partial [Planctomycetota bacterium]|nr:transcription antitermination factor NusB [Planctomycetota bacterium]
MRNVRALAAQVLRESERRFVDEVLETERGAALSRRDRALLTTLVYGVTRWRRELDWLIDRCAQRVHPEIRQHLRVALFQIRHLDKIPRHAAVDEAVELAKGVSRKSAGFVNAVLRKAADLPLPETLGVRTSHPDWLIERWRRRFAPRELESILASDNAVLPLSIRPNPLRATGPALLEGDPAADPAFTRGEFTIQDETSMKVAPLLDPRPGERVLDLCAAPGGKTTHLAELMGGRGRVVAVDLPDRIGLVAESARRLGLQNVLLVAGDGARIAFREPFDAILLDAPCSNTGVLARRPDVRWRLREKDIAGAAEFQEALLENAARLLAPGGRLVYSTCSLEPEENRVRLPGFRVVTEELTLPTDRHSGGYQALV